MALRGAVLNPISFRAIAGICPKSFDRMTFVVDDETPEIVVYRGSYRCSIYAKEYFASMKFCDYESAWKPHEITGRQAREYGWV